MTEYTLEIDNGHLLLYLDNYVGLIDTGAPNSFGNTSTLKLYDKEYTIPKFYFGITVEKIGKFIHRDIDFVIGMDILSKYDVLFTNESLILHPSKSLKIENQTNMKNIMGIPIILIKVDGTKVNSIFDTGAKISYIQNHLISNKKCIKNFNDFHPFSGEFETKVYKFDIEIDQIKMEIEAGDTDDLPDIVKMSVMNNCIIGSSILDNYNVYMSISQELFGLKLNKNEF